MRIKHAKLIIILIVFINVFLFYYSWKTFLWKTVLDVEDDKQSQQQKHLKSDNNPSLNNNLEKPKLKNANKHIRKSITIVFRNFYNFENDLKGSIDSILEILPNIPIIVIQDTIPYPPLNYVTNTSSGGNSAINNEGNGIGGGGGGGAPAAGNSGTENNIRFMSLGFDITKNSHELSPLLAIKTKYALFMPDSVRVMSKNLLQKILKEMNNFNAELEENANRMNGNNNNNNKKLLIIVPFAGNLKSFLSCSEIVLDLPNWTIEYNAVNTSEKCDLYLQKHAILIDVSSLLDMPDALAAPFPEMLYVQAKIAGIKKRIFPGSFQDGKRLFVSYHTKQRRMEIRRKQFKEMYKKLQIKRIIRRSHKISTKTDISNNVMLNNNINNNNLGGIVIGANPGGSNNVIINGGAGTGGAAGVAGSSTGSNTNIINNNDNNNMNLNLGAGVNNGIGSGGKEIMNIQQHNLILDIQFSSSNFSLPLLTEIDLIGCERTTKSCIGPVYNMKPFYVYLNKHTPPCCIEKLKSVFYHVLEEFENVGIRYWLDNLALKSAIEINQLSPDAYDIDISFNSYDLERSSPLKKSQNRPFIDGEGFYWIKATDGQYFRVQYSKMNQIGVNLLPFEINGDRVRPNGFFGWKAKEFSSEFLHPMSTVLFLSKNIMCPNNVREFLDYKFNHPN